MPRAPSARRRCRPKPAILSQAIRRRTQQEVFAIARKALSDLASASLEERMVEMFIRRLRAMDGKARAGLAEALKTAVGPGDRAQRIRSSDGAAHGDTKGARRDVLGRIPPPVRDLARPDRAASNSRQMAKRSPGASRNISPSLENSIAEILKAKENPNQGPRPSRTNPSRDPRARVPKAHDRGAGKPARRLRRGICRDRQGARGLHGATDSARGWHDYQRVDRRRPGFRPSRRGLRNT